MTVGRNIRAIRLRQGLTLDGLSELCGIHRDDLGQYERGEMTPRADTVRRIAGALGVPIAAIRDGVGWTASQTAEDWETAGDDGLLYGGILENLRESYGAVDGEAAGDPEDGGKRFLVGTGAEGFLLEERDVLALMEAVKASIPALIERMKDVRPEKEIACELLEELDLTEEDAGEALVRQYALTDEQWAQVKDLLPPERGGRGRAFKSNRLMLDGILFRMKSGLPWSKLPERYGRARCVEDRLQLWRRTGVWERVLDKLAELHIVDG